MERPRHAIRAAAAALCVVALGAAGCGGDSDGETNVRPAADPQGATDPNKDPFAATCEELLNSPDLYSQATVKLARRVRLTDANSYQVVLRLRNAITDICDEPARADYLPAAKAVEAVRRGKYATARG